MNENILEIKNLSKDYDKFKLDNISFTVKKGYIMGFIGPNGAGKSTTIKLIMNLLKKNSGQINIFGKDNIKYEREVKQRIGFVYDENYFYDDLKISQMKKIIAPFYKEWDDKAFDRYLLQFNLDRDKRIKELSKGMKMKFSLAVALSHNAQLIIMDEPTAGLDPVFRSEILDILYELIEDENKAIFFSTHITTDLDKIADYITFINKGQIVFSESKEEIFEKYSIIKGGLELINEESKGHFIGLRKNSYGFEALTNSEKIKKLYRNHAVIEKATLEDIMVYTVRG
ncbi:ABC transporter ATP-binding protein [Clostridiaceae bacterium M8S5]|nr:ABC transporter ATP-binding protein [Clostridiaceae bacterium M8S5]